MADRKDGRPLARTEMSDEEFNNRMEIGFSQAKACEGDSVDAVIERLLLHAEILKGIDEVLFFCPKNRKHSRVHPGRKEIQ